MATKLKGDRSIRDHLTELVVIFVGVALAFAVENLRDDLNEKAVGEQYLQGFREDLTADLSMLQTQMEVRRAQLQHARTALEFFEGRTGNPQQFFEAYWPVLPALNTTPNRNTMVEVLSSGNLRLIRDPDIRKGLLDLYANYDRIAHHEEHMARDFDVYLYDPTFSNVRLQVEGPWEDTDENRRAVDSLLNDMKVENGLRLVDINLDFPETGLLQELETGAFAG